MDNKLAQSEELLALNSIYEDKLAWDDHENSNGRYMANVQLNKPFFVSCKRDKIVDEGSPSEDKIGIEYLPPINLVFSLPDSYPSTTCPAFLLTCNWLTLDQLSKLCKHLELLWQEGNGEVVLFSWIQFLQEETLRFLSIHNCLDITELSRCSLKTNFINNINEHEKNVLSVVNDFKSLGSSNFKDGSLHKCVVPESTSFDSDLVTENRPHMQKNNNVNDLNIAVGSIKPSISGGCRSKDKRAFLDLPDGRNLFKFLLDFDQFKKQEEFEMSYHTCKICFLDKKGQDFVKIRGCNHTYCRNCLQLYFEVQIKEGNVHSLNCPDEKCTFQADGTLVKQLVRNDLFDKYDALLLSRTLETMTDIAYCPRKMCQCPLLIDSVGRIGTCPACKFVFCPYCKMVYHGIAPCNFKSEEKQKIYDEYMKGNAEQKHGLELRFGKRTLQSLVENTLSENWVKSFSKSCPRCNASIEKTDGCNKMTCFRCGTYFCWLCKQTLNLANPYMHYNDRSSQCFDLLFPNEYLDDAFEIEPGEFLN